MTEIKKRNQANFKKTVLVTALLLEMGLSASQAATINVDGVTCTLGDAITSANTDLTTGGCSAGNAEDTLELNVDGVYSLMDPLPIITTNITINGNGSTVTRDPGANSGFAVFISNYNTFNLNDTTVTGGLRDYGAGILINNNSNVNLDNCVIANNNGGGILLIGATSSSITNSVIDSNIGGAYYNGGITAINSQLNINNSIISNNSTSTTLFSKGGGVLNVSSSSGTSNLLIENSTITGNSTPLSGGGIAHFQYSGSGSIIAISNSTISGNTSNDAGGGISLESGVTATLTNLTVTDNISTLSGGGIDIVGGEVTLVQSLISGNVSGAAGREINVSGGTLATDDFNLFGFSGDSGLSGITAGASDFVPTQALDAIVDTNLADNGGITLTHNLLVGSISIDAVPTIDCALPTDQRGVVRPSGNACDIGAVESLFDDVIFKSNFD